MLEKRFLLSLDNVVFTGDAQSLRSVEAIRELDGDKFVFSDFEAAVPQVGTVEAESKYASAVLEKQLREAGEIEAGGRLVVLLKRNRGQRKTEMLYIVAPGVHAIENELERDREEFQYLVFPVQQLIADELSERQPRDPIAIMLLNEGYVDVVVADRFSLYGAFRIATPATGANVRLLSQNLDNALRGYERDFNIRIQGFDCLHLLTSVSTDYGWIKALGDARDISYEFLPATEVTVDGAVYRSSVLDRLLQMRAVKSCSPRSVIGNHYANIALPWMAGAMLSCCMLALFVLADRQVKTVQLQREVAALSASINSKLAQTPPPAMVDYHPYLGMAQRLAYAREVPALQEVLGNVAGAAGNKETIFADVVVEYNEENIVVTLVGTTEKSSSGDSMGRYNDFVAELRREGYALTKSELDTETREVKFKLQLTRPIRRGHA